MAEQRKPRRRFIYAPDMDELGNRVKKIHDEMDKVEKIVEEAEAKADYKPRFEYLVVAVQDFERGLIDKDELSSALKLTLDGVEEELAPEVRT